MAQLQGRNFDENQDQAAKSPQEIVPDTFNSHTPTSTTGLLIRKPDRD
jgi:hypothetical protein